MIPYLAYSLGLISVAVFFFSKANTFQEYSNNAYIATSMTISITVFTNIILKTSELFKLIKNVEEVVEKSK